MGYSLSVSGGAQFALDKAGGEAEKALNTEIQAGLDSMGLGDFPVNVKLDDISPEGIKTAVTNGGIAYAEAWVNEVSPLPVPIHLPRKLTLEELRYTFGFAIPTDLDSALNLALNLGGQAIAAGVTSLLVGAGVGSVVPGLGTIVGIGVALGISALRGALAPEPNIVWCTKGWECRIPGPEQTPFMVLADGLSYYTLVSSYYADDQARGYCEGGPIWSCQSLWNDILEGAAAASLGTAKRMTMVEVREALNGLRSAPRAYVLYDAAQRRTIDHLYADTEWKFKTQTLLGELEARERELDAMYEQLNRFNAGLLTDQNSVWKLRNQLLDESSIAAVAVQNSADGLRPRSIFDGNALALAQIIDGFERTRLRLIEMGTTPPPAPTTLPTDPMSVAARAVAPYYLALTNCSKLYDLWAAGDPRAACVDGDTKSYLIGLCLSASAQHITLEEMTAQADAIVNQACARRQRADLWAAFRGGFRSSGNPFRLFGRS